MTIKDFNINIFQLFLICILPATFVISPFILEVLINFISLVFLFEVFKKKKFYIFKNILFAYIIIFYFYLVLLLLNSDFFKQTYINIFFYFRFVIFAFALFELLKKNSKYIKYIFYSILLTLFVICADGLFQFYSGENIFGYPKYREDRISGFFNDELVLGSYLLRSLPVLVALTFFFQKNNKIFLLSSILLFLCLYTIFLSGERASFLLSLIYIISLFLTLKISGKFKLYFGASILIVIITTFFINSNIFDRYYNQLKRHIYTSKLELSLFSEYMPMFQTSYKMFKDNILFGQGPKSFRYVCDDDKFESFYVHRTETIDNTIVKVQRVWKEKDSRSDLIVDKFLVKKGDKIKIDQPIFTFKFEGSEKLYEYKSDIDGIVEKVYFQKNLIPMSEVLKITPTNRPKKEIIKFNACNTHTHNFYLQLLGETGIIGFLFVFILFLYLAYKFLIYLKLNFIIKGKDQVSNSEIALIIGFFIFLWPLTTTGNFFNNWLNILNYYPLGFYLFFKHYFQQNEQN